MNKIQIREVMAIARPAIISMYGRQALKLSAYSILDSASIWIQVQGKVNTFKLKIYKGKVEYINIGKLSV